MERRPDDEEADQSQDNESDERAGGVKIPFSPDPMEDGPASQPENDAHEFPSRVRPHLFTSPYDETGHLMQLVFQLAVRLAQNAGQTHGDQSQSDGEEGGKPRSIGFRRVRFFIAVGYGGEGVHETIVG